MGSVRAALVELRPATIGLELLKRQVVAEQLLRPEQAVEHLLARAVHLPQQNFGPFPASSRFLLLQQIRKGSWLRILRSCHRQSMPTPLLIGRNPDSQAS